MMAALCEISLLAQDQQAPGSGSIWPALLPLVILFALFYLIILRPQRRDQRRVEEMLKALKKNDRVLTRGGIFGSVANISPDGQKVTLKVDDNVRIPVHRSYIVTVLGDDEAGEGEAKKS